MMWRHGASTLEQRDGVYHVILREKDRYAQGFAYGRLLSQAGHPNVAVYRSPAVRLPVTLMSLGVHRMIGRSVRIPPEYLEEIRGWSDGAGLSYRHLFFANFCYDIMPAFGLHCSTIAFFNEQSMMLLRNTDLRPYAARLAVKHWPSVLVDMALPGTRRIVHLAPPFFLGVISGYSDAYLAAATHQVLKVRETRRPAPLATPLLLRMILERAATLPEADAFIREHPIARSLNVLIASALEREARIYEINSRETNRLGTSHRYLCSTSHFQSKRMRRHHIAEVVGSPCRLASMQRLIQEHSELTADQAVALLRDKGSEAPFGDSGHSFTNSGTYQSLFAELPAGRIAVANGRRIPVSESGRYIYFDPPDWPMTPAAGETTASVTEEAVLVS